MILNLDFNINYREQVKVNIIFPRELIYFLLTLRYD